MMLNIYFIFSNECELSKRVIRRLNFHFNKPVRSYLGEAYNFIKINPIEYGYLDPRIFKAEVKKSDAVVILWSSKCYNKENEINSDYIKEELETLGEELYYKYLFPVSIQEATTESLKNGFLGSRSGDITFSKSVSQFINRLYPYPLISAISDKKIDQTIVLVLNTVLSNILSFYKPPLNFNKFYGDDYRFINKIMTNYRGGIFFRINNKSKDYADILDKGLLYTNKSFFATLTEYWFNILIKDEDTSRNFEWMKATNDKATRISDRVIRILIANGNKSIDKLGKENVRKVYEVNEKVEFYFTNKNNLNTKIFNGSIPIYDFALLDEKLIINADLQLVKTSYLNDFKEIKDFHDTIIRALDNKSTFDKRYILNKEQIESIIYS